MTPTTSAVKLAAQQAVLAQPDADRRDMGDRRRHQRGAAVTLACWLMVLAAFAAGIAITVVLWAASIVSGAHSDAESPIEE